MWDNLPKIFPKAEFVDGKAVMDQAKIIKTKDEIECQKGANMITEAGSAGHGAGTGPWEPPSFVGKALKNPIPLQPGMLFSIDPYAGSSGITYGTLVGRYRRQDERINQIISEKFLRGVSTRKVGKISYLHF